MLEDLLENLNVTELTKKLEEVLKDIDLATSKEEINTITEDLVTKSLDAEFSSIWFYDKENFVLIRERATNYVNKLPLTYKKGIMYKCFMTKESSLYNYLASDKDYVASVDNPDSIKIKSKLMLPLLEENGNLVGIVTAYNSIKKNKKFSKNDVEILKAISPYIINAVYKMHNPQKVKKTELVAVEEVKRVKTSQAVVENPDETLTFVANFVHDIRTPANTLYGFLDLLEGQIQDERLKTYLINAKESASFINELTTSVLNMVSTHRESVVSNVKDVDSIKFFSTIARSFASNMYAKNINFNIYIDPLIPKTIKLDTLKMKRVILNLIGNAYKFTPNYKSIEFSVRYISKTKRISIYIKDTGIGIPKEKQETIFEAFKQAEDMTALNYGGTGLGLFISAKYVNELGGNLALISGVDKGSIFSFDIPACIIDSVQSFKPINNIYPLKVAILMDPKNSFSATNIARHLVRMGLDKEQVKALSSFNEIEGDVTHLIIFQGKIDEAEIQNSLKKGQKILVVEEKLFSINKGDLCDSCDIISQYGYIANSLYEFVNIKKLPRVLIVDDDLVSVLLIQTILENEFCEISVARDGQEALDMILGSYEAQNPFTTLYIDNSMPIMDGLEVMQKVRAYEKENRLFPVYAISTSGDQVALKNSIRYFDLFLGKPFKKESIRKALYH